MPREEDRGIRRRLRTANKVRRCVDCGVSVSAGSTRCRTCDGKVRARLAWDVSPNAFVCEHCGRPALRRMGGHNLKNGSRRRWCSMACRTAASRRLNAEVKALQLIARAWRTSTRFTRLDEGIDCKTCGARFCRIVGQWNRGFCSDACWRSQREAARRVERRAQKAARRARERGADAERIDPLAVFKRDRWRCHLCGKHAPAALRGTYADAAPKLDHVIPLSQGGSHSWSNVALAHRQCNAAKSSRVLGQLLLDAFAAV